jgi:lysophospholipase L1-like esterase
MTNRRNFLKGTAALTAGASLLPLFASAEFSRAKSKKIKLKQDAVVLFQGDSITDATREKNTMKPNDYGALGNGYAAMVATQLLFDNKDKNLKIYNRGISGNKVFQLADRWDNDCLMIKPDVLSIMVGVNDYWHTLTNNYKGTIQTYKDDYIALLKRTKDQLPDVQLIISEPYAIKGVRAVTDTWYPAFDEYRHIAKEVAEQYDATFIPLQSIFDRAQEVMPGIFWTRDGIHPSISGMQIMAHTWLEFFK